MTGDVSGERRRDECRRLIGDPLDGADPLHSARPTLRVLGPAPGADSDLALVAVQRRVPPAGPGRLRRDELDESRHERQSLRVVRGEVRVARLSMPAQVPDHRDRPDAVVLALQAPRHDRRVVDGAVQGQVELHVPLQAIDRDALPADPQIRPKLVRDGVGDHVPVSRGRLGLRSIGPELGQRAGEIALVHDLPHVRLAGHRIHASTVAVIPAQRVVAARRRRDVDHHRAGRVHLRAGTDHASLYCWSVAGSPRRGGGPGSIGTPSAPPSGIPKPLTCPHCGPIACWVPLVTGIPFWLIMCSS